MKSLQRLPLAPGLGAVQPCHASPGAPGTGPGAHDLSDAWTFVMK